MTTFARPERLEFNVYLTKQSKAVRVGITFESDEDAAASGRQARPRVKSLAPYGLASTNGLQIGDEIININGQRVTTPLAAASMLRELSGDMRIGVRRPHPVHPREAAGAAGSSAQAAAGLPKLSLGAVTSQEPEERDLGELSARAIKGVADFFSSIGDDLSRMLQPKQHTAASTIAAHWRGYRSRLLLARWRWAATELERLRRGTVVRQEALRQHQAAIVLQSAARGHVDRLWTQMLRDQLARREEMIRAQGAEAEALAWMPDRRRGGGAKRVEKTKRAFSFQRKRKQTDVGRQIDADAPDPPPRVAPPHGASTPRAYSTSYAPPDHRHLAPPSPSPRSIAAAAAASEGSPRRRPPSSPGPTGASANGANGANGTAGAAVAPVWSGRQPFPVVSSRRGDGSPASPRQSPRQSSPGASPGDGKRSIRRSFSWGRDKKDKDAEVPL